MKKYLLIVIAIYYALSTHLYADSVKAMVNTQEVVKGNPVELRLKAIGGIAAFPEIKELGGVSVQNGGTSTQTSMQITASGTKSERSTVKRYLFTPVKDTTIPALSVRIGDKTYQTKPIVIKVVESHAPQVKENATFAFELKSDKTTVYAGEPFLVTLYMAISNELKGIQLAEYMPPSTPDFFIKELPKQKEYQQGNHTVLEMRYLFTPKKEGNFTIAPAKAKLGQLDFSKQDIFGRPGRSWMNISSNKLKIKVKPLNVDADIIGDFTLEAKIDKQKVKANKPVNLTITIEGKGGLEDFEFPKYEIDGVTVYANEAQKSSQVDGTTLLSSYTQSFAFISSDDFTIPAREIEVYNPETKQKKTLKIPSYHIDIEGKKATATVAAPIVQQKEKPEQPVVSSEVVHKNEQTTSAPWWMLAIAFALGALFMYLLQFFLKVWQRKERKYKESDALKILYGHISEDKAVEEMVRKLYAKKRGDKSVKIDKKVLKKLLERYR